MALKCQWEILLICSARRLESLLEVPPILLARADEAVE